MGKAIQVSADTNKKIVSGLAPVFSAVAKAKNFVNQAKGVAGIGDEAAQAGKTVGENTKQLQDSKQASEPDADDKKVQGSYKKGGKVKKTGIYRLHKNERVLNSKDTKKLESKGGLPFLRGK